VALSRDDLWKRFVQCDQREQRIGCSLIGDKPVTLVDIRFDSPTSATVWVSNEYVITTRCPTGTPLPQPIIGNTFAESFHMSYVNGAWGEVRPGSKVAC
jgi:hypothetical protein